MINTVMILATFVSAILVAGGWKRDVEQAGQNNAAEIRRLEREEDKRWQDHEQLHRDRFAETRDQNARFDQRIKELENTKIRRDGQVEGLQARTAALEALNRDISTKLNDVVSDTKVVKEILQQWKATTFQNRQ